MKNFVTQEEHDEECRKKDFPFCDFCDHAAVWNEARGWMHSTPGAPFGDFRPGQNEHEVTVLYWMRDQESAGLDI